MTEASTSPQPTLDCPRCGYVLRAMIEASEARGESGGTCTECGLPIVWRQLRDIDADPRWFTESRNGHRRLATRALLTLARCANPFGFWSSISMTIPTRRRGIVAFVLALLVAAHLTTAAFRCAWLSQIPYWGPPTTLSRPLSDYAFAVVAPLSPIPASDVVTRIRPRRGSATVPIVINLLYAGYVYPFTMLDDFSGERARERITGRFISAMATPLAAPLLIALLPVSMRRAKVRKRHLVRGSVYALVAAIPILALLLSTNEQPKLPTSNVLEMLWSEPLLVVAFPLALVWCWAFAARYLRIQHAPGVAVACVTIAALIAVSLQYSLVGPL